MDLSSIDLRNMPLAVAVALNALDQEHVLGMVIGDCLGCHGFGMELLLDPRSAREGVPVTLRAAGFRRSHDPYTTGDGLFFRTCECRYKSEYRLDERVGMRYRPSE